jgi:hypothetical protein
MTTVRSGPNLSWIDEELRKERNVIEELRGLVDKQQVILVDQAQRIMALEDRLAKLQGQLLRIPDVEQALQHTRDEIVLMLSEARQEAQKKETELIRSRQADREKDVKAIQDIQVQLERIGLLEQAMAVRQAEERRLNEALLRLQQELQITGKGLAQTEEWRRQLADAIAKNTVDGKQAQTDIETLHKAQQETALRLLPIQDRLSKVEQTVADLVNMRAELTSQQEQMMERQRREDRSRAQTLTEWGRRLDGYAHQIEAWADQLRFFADQHEKNRRVLRDIQTLAQEVSQQQDRLQQLQRLSEEQLRREMREARGENDKRWALDMERREQASAAQSSRDDAQELRLTDVEHGQQDHGATLALLTQRLAALRGDFQAALAQQQQKQNATLHSLARNMDDLLKEIHEILGGGA